MSFLLGNKADGSLGGGCEERDARENRQRPASEQTLPSSYHGFRNERAQASVPKQHLASVVCAGKWRSHYDGFLFTYIYLRRGYSLFSLGPWVLGSFSPWGALT